MMPEFIYKKFSNLRLESYQNLSRRIKNIKELNNNINMKIKIIQPEKKSKKKKINN
jgi:hypothetical protein